MMQSNLKLPVWLYKFCKKKQNDMTIWSIKMDQAKYWRVFYKIQGLLATEFIDSFSYEQEKGGVRNQSQLPQKLNNLAQGLALEIMELDKIKKVKKQKKSNMQMVIVTKEVFHTNLNKLEKDKRAFIDDEVIADRYFIGIDIEQDDIKGGFAISKNGTLHSLFSLEKGYGQKLLQNQIKIAKRMCNNGTLKLSCTGKFLRQYYEKEGFRAVECFRWDERLATKNWNGKKYGFPFIYTMVEE